MNETIDLKSQQAAIRERYSEPRQWDAALSAAALLWGGKIGEGVNHRGEFTDYETEAMSIGGMVKGEVHHADSVLRFGQGC